MTLDAHYRRLFDYHLWRVEQACTQLAAMSPALLDEPVHGSFASVRALIQHVVWVDRLWQARVHHQPNPPIAPVEALSWGELLATWQSQAQGWQRLAADLTDARLAERIPYRSAASYMTEHPGFEHPLSDLLFQAQDHTGYHLGQLAHALRQLGLKPASLGYAAWLWR